MFNMWDMKHIFLNYVVVEYTIENCLRINITLRKNRVRFILFKIVKVMPTLLQRTLSK